MALNGIVFLGSNVSPLLNVIISPLMFPLVLVLFLSFFLILDNYMQLFSFTLQPSSGKIRASNEEWQWFSYLLYSHSMHGLKYPQYPLAAMLTFSSKEKIYIRRFTFTLFTRRNEVSLSIPAMFLDWIYRVREHLLIQVLQHFSGHICT